MSGKLQDRNQREIFRTRLEDLIDPHHSLAYRDGNKEKIPPQYHPSQGSNSPS